MFTSWMTKSFVLATTGQNWFQVAPIQRSKQQHSQTTPWTNPTSYINLTISETLDYLHFTTTYTVNYVHISGNNATSASASKVLFGIIKHEASQSCSPHTRRNSSYVMPPSK